MAKISVRKSLEYLLANKYFGECQVIDGINQHPLGWNYEKWLKENNLISTKKDKLDDTSIADEMACR